MYLNSSYRPVVVRIVTTSKPCHRLLAAAAAVADFVRM